jgi:hypothetical protein
MIQLASFHATAAMPAATASAVTTTSGHCAGNTAGRPAANVLRLSRRHIAWETVGVEDAFGTVLVVVVVVAALVAVATLVASGRAYDLIGRGGMSLRDDRRAQEPAGGAAAGAPASTAGQRDEEIRQMLEARNARRARRGEAPLDVDAELAALRRPRVDAALEAEVRALVEARNARRARRGREPLDVEAEVARRLRALEDGG